MKKLWNWFTDLSLPKIIIIASGIILSLFFGLIAFTIAVAPHIPKQKKIAERPALKRPE